MPKPSPTTDQAISSNKDVPKIAPPHQNDAVALTHGYDFWSSGIFFMLMGCVFLGFGFLAQQNDDVHASFTFVLIVLGIAILLFGTGTQGVGSFRVGDNNTSPWLTGSIAGGAGLLAACAGFGLVKWQGEIRLAFANHETLYEVPIQLNPDGGGPPDYSKYAAIAIEGGEQRPVFRHRDHFVVLLSKPPTETVRSSSQVKTVVLDTEIKLLLIAHPDLKGVVPQVEGNFSIKGEHFSTGHTRLIRRNGFRRFSKVSKIARNFWVSGSTPGQLEELVQKDQKFDSEGAADAKTEAAITEALISDNRGMQ